MSAQEYRALNAGDHRVRGYQLRVREEGHGAWQNPAPSARRLKGRKLTKSNLAWAEYRAPKQP